MSDTQITLEFLANTDGLKAAAQQMRILGSITNEQYQQFIKAGKENERTLQAQQKAQKDMGNAVKQNADNAKGLSDQFRVLNQTIVQTNLTMVVQQFNQVAVQIANVGAEADKTAEKVKKVADVNPLQLLIDSCNAVVTTLKLAKDSLAFFGDESKALEETITDVEAAVKVLSGVQDTYNKVLGEAGVLAKAGAAAQQAYSFVVGTSTGALKAFRIALAATGIGLIVLAIAELVTHWDELTEAVGLGNKAMQELATIRAQAADSAAKEVSKIQLLIEKYKSANTSQADKIKIIEQLKKLSPAYFGNLDKEKTSIQELEKAYQRYAKAMVLKATADGIAAKIAEKEIAKIEENNKSIDETLNLWDNIKIAGQGMLSVYFSSVKPIDQATVAQNKHKKVVGELDKEIGVLQNSLVELTKQLETLGGDPTAKAAAGLNKVKQSATGAAKKEEGPTQEQLFEKFKQSFDENKIDEPLITESSVNATEVNAERQADLIAINLQQATKYNKDYVESIQNDWQKLTDFINNPNSSPYLVQLAQIERIKLELRIMTGYAQQAFDTIFQVVANQLQAELQAQQQKLTRQRELELQNKNLTEQQKDAINKRYADQEAKLKRRAYEQDKQAKLAQAAINGALAITNILATRPKSDFGIGDAIMIATAVASTAAQIAVIASTPVPQFARGGKNIPAGMKLVGEQGPELIWTPGGETVIPHGDTAKILEAWSIPVPNVNPALKTDAAIAAALPAGIDYNKLAQAFAQQLRNNPSVNISMDNNGFAMHLLQKNKSVQLLNNRYSA